MVQYIAGGYIRSKRRRLLHSRAISSVVVRDMHIGCEWLLRNDKHRKGKHNIPIATKLRRLLSSETMAIE